MATLSALILVTALSAGNPTANTQAANTQAADTQDVVLLQFTAPWCGPCRSMEPAIRRLVDDGYPIRKVNIDDHPELARQYNVRPIPCFVLVEQGREVDRLVGATSYDRLVQLFRAHANTRQATPARDRVLSQQQWDGLTRGERQPDAYQKASHTLAYDRSGGREVRNASQTRGSTTGTANRPPRQRAKSATVRLKVSDPQGHSFGSGTIIDVHQGEALVVTCGHVFRDSGGKGEIEITLFTQQGEVHVAGQLLTYEADKKDIGLVYFRLPMPVEPALVGGSETKSLVGDAVFSVGCDRGGIPSVRNSRVTHVNRYIGAANIEAAGQPVDGRSGGGLFNSEGQLIGICNAADPQDDEGVYAALETIHTQLDQVGQGRIYGASESDATVAGGLLEPSSPMGASPPHTSSASSATGVATMQNGPSNNRDNDPRRSPTGVAAPSGNSELICIIRAPGSPDGRRVIVVDNPSVELLEALRAQQSGVHRGELSRQGGSHDPAARSLTPLPRIHPPDRTWTAAAPATRPRNPRFNTPSSGNDVVRGQNAYR